MRFAPVAVLFSLIGLFAPSAVAAQEAQVPLDEAGEVLEVDRRLAQRLELFVDRYPDMELVRLYEADGEAYVLEVTLRRDGRAMRERVEMDAEQVRELRARVSAALAARAPEVVLNQDGRFILLGTTALLGIGFYGWAVPVILEIDSGRGFLATYMLTAGASFALPYFYTDNRPVTYGMANAGFWGATRGVTHGSLLGDVLGVESARTASLLGMGGSLAEGLGGYMWARNVDMSAGTAHTIGNFGDFGSTWGAFSMLVAQPEDGDVLSAAMLGGAAAGLALGAYRGARLPYTWGDAEVQRAGFYLGAFNGLAAWDLLVGDGASDNNLRGLGGLLILGSGAGVYLADRQLAGRDFSAGEGILVDLATVAGGALGVGVGVLVGSEVDTTLLLTLGAIGADAAYAFTVRSLGDAEQSGAGGQRHGALDLQLNPGALMMLHPSTPALPGSSDLAVPVVSVRYRF